VGRLRKSVKSINWDNTTAGRVLNPGYSENEARLIRTNNGDPRNIIIIIIIIINSLFVCAASTARCPITSTNTDQIPNKKRVNP
jgi:hypothetical protein